MLSVAHAASGDSTPHPQEKPTPLTFVQGSSEDIPVAAHSADLIFLSMVYHHIQDKDRACEEFRRVLRPGSYLWIRTSTSISRASGKNESHK